MDVRAEKMKGAAMKKAIPERKYYLDNLRMIAIMLLIPTHTDVLYAVYVLMTRTNLRAPAMLFRNLIDPWWSGLIFALAGITLYHSLTRRSLGELLKERTSKLLVPLFFTLLLFMLVFPYLFELMQNGSADYFKFITNLVNRSGGFDSLPFLHLYFILFLYPITLVFAPIASFLQRHAKKNPTDKASFVSKLPWPLLFLFGVIPFGLQTVLIIPLTSIGSTTYYSVSKYAAYFLLGYFLLTEESVMEKLEKYRFASLGIFIAAMLLLFFAPFFALRRALYHMAGWFACMAFFGLARRYLNCGGSKIFRYFSKSSFAVYLFHLIYTVVSFYLLLKMLDNLFLLISLTMLCTFALSFLTYEILKRFRVTRWMFALKR